MNDSNFINLNIGLLGHVDSGKTTLARALSTIAGTAAYDKNPQSKERGITLDLGFSAVLLEPPPPNMKAALNGLEKLQLTFVDCPGHASLIRTIIGGAQIIDLVILVVDAQKGIQTQTAECIVIAEILQRELLVVVNKVDLLDEQTRDAQLAKLNTKLRKTFAGTRFGDVPIYNVSALGQINIQELLTGICGQLQLPQRNVEAPLIMYVDHCFSIKGQGTICTGTIVQGRVAVNDNVEIPVLREQRKVKSMQMFRRPVTSAGMGDRLGICVTQFNAKLLERGVLAKPGYLQPIYAALIALQPIKYYKFAIKSKSKLHISVGHDTVMGKITLFEDNECCTVFDVSREYEYVAELDQVDLTAKKIALFALIEFETPIWAAADATLIASKLDGDACSNYCRLAFWGCMQWISHSSNYATEQLTKFKVFKRKTKESSIQRYVNEQQLIVQNLFKKQANRDLYVGKRVELSTGESGIIESTFGQTSKVKLSFPSGLKPETVNLLKDGKANDVKVLLKFKKLKIRVR